MKVIPTQPSLRHRKLAVQAPALSLCLFLLGSLALPALSGVTAKNYATEKSVYDLCNQANQALSAGAYEQARSALVQAAANDPTSYSADVHAELANAYSGLKDYDHAIGEAEAALKFDPGRNDAIYTIANSYYAKRQFDDATTWLQKFLAVSKDEVWKVKAQKLIVEISAFKNMKSASSYIKSERYGDAKKVLERAAAADPSPFSASVHANLAFVLERTGNPEQAIIEGQKALKLDANDKSTVYLIAIAYQDIGKFDDAISWLKRYSLLETDDEARARANNFMQELADDRSKLNDSANSKADYLDQLRKNDSVEMWPRGSAPLLVYISPSTGVYGYRPLFKSFVIRALDTWCAASGKKFNYKVVDDPDKAQIKVSFTRDDLSLQENNRTRQKAGLTTPHINEKTHEIDSEDVRIRTVNGFDPKRLISDGEAASTCMHEIGHAMGLGHSTCYSDIMYFGASSKMSGYPTKRDKATIARLYEDYPQVKFTPSSTSTSTSGPIQYLPPPAFVPPLPPDTKKLAPPLFMPPPIRPAAERLQPPLFVPPPVSEAHKSKKIDVPLFVPPPLPAKKTHQTDPRLFVPPPK